MPSIRRKVECPGRDHQRDHIVSLDLGKQSLEALGSDLMRVFDHAFLRSVHRDARGTEWPTSQVETVGLML